MTRAHRWLLPLLFAVCVARLWLMALPSGFWVDETVTAFVVDRPHDASLAVAPQVPASLYYTVARVAVKLGGTSEAVYRIPSLLAMLAAVWLVARLAARLLHRDAAWFAAFACLAVYGIDYFAVDARPYALGILAASAALWFLVRWLDEARWRDAAAFAICAALVWRIHLAYWPFYAVAVLYAAARLASGKTKVPWKLTLAVFGAVALALVPVAAKALAIEGQAAAHVVAAPPSWRDFLHLLRWNVVVIAGVGAWIAGRFKRPQRRLDESAVLILAWWLAPPLLLYAVSIATGESVYVTRYLSVALPGVALAATLAASLFLPVRWWRGAAALMGIGALLAHGQWNRIWPRHEKSGWREASAEVNRYERAGAVPLICPSPFVEAKPPVWRPDYPLPGFLYAYLAYYPVGGRPILFPFENSREADAYAVQVLNSALTPAGQFLIYGGAGQTEFWQKWFTARPELRTWHNRRDQFGDVYVARFWRG